MKNLTLAFPVLFLISSCAQVQRNIASASLKTPDLTHLKLASEQILTDVQDYQFAPVCVTYLRDLEKKIDAMDFRKIPQAELLADAEEVAKRSWEIRSVLHSRLNEFDKECVLQVQSNFRQFRFIEDYLLELSRKVTHKTPADIDFQKQAIPMKENESFYEFNQNGDEKLHSGDLLITRGVSFLSGMIARLGQRSTQFSHVVMVHEDSETKKLKTIESYVGVGVAFYDMDYALKNENARILWLRAKDTRIGEKASELMGALVKERLAQKNPIKYDYELNFNDPKTMSCAEVSQVAFQMASNNEFKIPYYPNVIAGAKSIIERLKLVEGDTYEPGDMEIDPRFELVGEFRDLRLTRDSRQKDAIMTAIFDWMEERNYVLVDNMKSRLAGGLIYDVRRTFMWPLVKKVLKLDDFSKEIPRNMLRTVTIINQLGAEMLKELKARDEKFEKDAGLPMSYMDFYRALEEMRSEDLKLYENKKTRKQAIIHKYLRSSKN